MPIYTDRDKNTFITQVYSEYKNTLLQTYLRKYIINLIKSPYYLLQLVEIMTTRGRMNKRSHSVHDFNRSCVDCLHAGTT